MKIEVKLYELAEDMRKKGNSEDEITHSINKEREILLERMKNKVDENIE